MKTCVISTPIGNLRIVEDGTGIAEISVTEETECEACSPLLSEAVTQLSEYFECRRKVFDLPLSLHGTAFQLKDWNALRTIPYGETRSYQDIANMIDCPKGCRAVGMANHVNPILIVVPCHRVIGKNGSLTGYGAGIDRKQYLLRLEQEGL